MQRRQDRLAQHLATLAPPDEILTVLDVGCGNGQIASNLQGRLPTGSQIRGVDVLVRPHTYVPVTPFDGRRLPFENESFDYVMLIDVLHHTLNIEELLAECLRVSRRGVWLKDHLCNNLWDSFRLHLLDWVGNWAHGVNLPYNYLSNDQWESLFERLKVQPLRRQSELGMYPAALRWFLERSLNFLTLLQPID